MATTPKPKDNLDLEYKIDDKEAFVVYNIFNKVKDAFIKWIAAYFVFVTLAITYAGYKGYQEIITDINKHVANMSKDKFDTIMEASLNKEAIKLSAKYDKVLNSRIDTLMVRHDKEFAQWSSNYSKRLNKQINEGISEINKSSKSNIPLLKANIPKRGFLYYGIFKNNRWEEINFKNISRSGKFPKAGDKVSITFPVNVREQAIEYSASQGWKNKKLIGTLDLGTTVTIKNVIRVKGKEEYIWIEYEQ